MILDKVIIELVPDESDTLKINACLVYGTWANTSLPIIPESPLTNPNIGMAVEQIRFEIRRILDYKIDIPNAFYEMLNG
jgi:hypothetical protein